MSTRRSMIDATLRLGLFAALTAVILGLTYVTTKPNIEAQIVNAERQTLYEVLPRNYFDNELLEAAVARPDWLQTATNQDAPIYLAYQGQTLTAIVFRTDTLEGYSGRISLMIAVTPDADVIGARVISHKETPGLGDKIELRKSDWILSFDGQEFSLDDQSRWDVKKYDGQFDQFTGATITPRAIVLHISDVLSKLSEHHDWIEELTNG
jgi:electron transport complex protein RnfG